MVINVTPIFIPLSYLDGWKVGAPGVRERRPPGRHRDKRYYYLYPHILPRPTGKPARSEGHFQGLHNR